MEKVKEIQEERTKEEVNKEYTIEVKVYRNSDKDESVENECILKQEFYNIDEANSYIREHDKRERYFELVLKKELVLENAQGKDLDYHDVEAEVRILLNGCDIAINTDQVICAAKVDGSRWKEEYQGMVLAAAGKLEPARGISLTFLPGNTTQGRKAAEVSFLELAADDNKLILGGKEQNGEISFRKVAFDGALRTMEVNGSFSCMEPAKNDDRGIEVKDSLSVFNEEQEVFLCVPIRVKNLELHGRLSVADLTSKGSVKTDNQSVISILADGMARLENMEIFHNADKKEHPFVIFMEQNVELGKYKDHSAKDWEDILGKQREKKWPEDIFHDVKIISARGRLQVNGQVKVKGFSPMPMILEKRYCWESMDAEGEKTVFSCPVEFEKKTVFEKGESVAVIRREEANHFASAYRNVCLEKYGNELRAVSCAITVVQEGTKRIAEYESLQEAAANLKTDFNIGRKRGGNKEPAGEDSFIFIFRTDHTLTKNVVLPGFVKKAKFVTEKANTENGWLIRKLDLNEYSITTLGSLSLGTGLQVLSSGKAGNLKLVGKDKNIGLNIYTPERLFWDDGESYSKEIFYPVKNVNILSAEGSIFLAGERKAGIRGSITVRECIVDSGIWRVNDITAANLLVGNTEEGIKKGILECEKIHVFKKLVVEEQEHKNNVSERKNTPEESGESESISLEYERIRCRQLKAKRMELYAGTVSVSGNAHIKDLYLFSYHPVLKVEGKEFHIQGNVYCAAPDALLVTAVKEEGGSRKDRKKGKKEKFFIPGKKSVLRIDGEVKIYQGREGVAPGDKITVSVVAGGEKRDLRNNKEIRNVLLTAPKAMENVFQAGQQNGLAYIPHRNEEDSYILKKQGKQIEVCSGRNVKVALYRQEDELRLINYYEQIEDAMNAIDALREKEGSYVVTLKGNIGEKEKAVQLKLPSYAESLTFLSEADETYTVYCSKSIVQDIDVRWEKVRLRSSGDYSVRKGCLELADSELQVKRLRAGDVRMLYSDLTAMGTVHITDLILAGEKDGNTGILTAYDEINITNLKGAGTLIAYHTYTAKAWKKAVSRMTIKGRMEENVILDLRPCFFNPWGKVYYSFLNEEGEFDSVNFGTLAEDLMVAGNEKPQDFKKILKAKKLSNKDQIIFYGIHPEEVWPVKYKDGIYFTKEQEAIRVSVLDRGTEEVMGVFRRWEEAVREINKNGNADKEYVINLRDSIGTGKDTPLKKLSMPYKAKRIMIEGNGVNGILMEDTKVSLKTNTVFSNMFLAAVKKKGRGYTAVPYMLKTGQNHLLLHNMIEQGTQEEKETVYKGEMRIAGIRDSVADIVYEGSESCCTDMILKISNVGKVFFHSVEPLPGEKERHRADYIVKEGILGVEELTLDQGVRVRCAEKDLWVKNLTMGAEQDHFSDEGLRCELQASNITVYDNTIMRQSEMKAGTEQRKNGRIKLNYVTFQDSSNRIEGKTDKKGKSLVTVRGKLFNSDCQEELDNFYQGYSDSGLKNANKRL